MIPTLFGITIICFFIINLAPGSPIEQKLQAIRFAGAQGGESARGGGSKGDQGVSQEVIDALKKQYGFDKPILTRYGIWLGNIARLDFGSSFTYEEPVLGLIVSKFPVSLQFGLISFVLTYLICIPLGVMQAIRQGTRFDRSVTATLLVLYSIPSVMLAILLIVFFAGGSFWRFFPIGELYSDGYEGLSFGAKILDRIHHFILPLLCYMLGSFTVLTKVMKDSMIEVIRLDYIRTAEAKGLSEKVVHFKHALRNALIPIATGLSGFLGVFFAGSLVIEQIFQLDGIGLLSFKSLLSRDYNVIMALIFIQSVLLLFGRLISDLLYVAIDPRIDFR
jgi:microcin C transport system permease protein